MPAPAGVMQHPTRRPRAVPPRRPSSPQRAPFCPRPSGRVHLREQPSAPPPSSGNASTIASTHRSGGPVQPRGEGRGARCCLQPFSQKSRFPTVTK